MAVYRITYAEKGKCVEKLVVHRSMDEALDWVAERYGIEEQVGCCRAHLEMGTEVFTKGV